MKENVSSLTNQLIDFGRGGVAVDILSYDPDVINSACRELKEIEKSTVHGDREVAGMVREKITEYKRSLRVSRNIH